MEHALEGPVRRVRYFVAGLAAVLLIPGLGGSTAAAPASVDPAMASVVMRGWTGRVPVAWPVVDLRADPGRCVRFDVYAVYLGRPGSNPACPSHQVGRADGLLVEPIETASDPRPADVTSPSPRVAGPLPAAALSAHEVRVAIPSAGVMVTAVWRADPSAVEQVLAAATATPGYRPPPSASAARGAPRDTPRVVGLDGFTGKGFDACDAPSQSLLSAWSASPYRAVGAYVGGVNRACSQPNLTGTWVNQVLDSGWRIIAIYVGLQSPSTSCRCAAIDPTQAASQGAAAADDAVGQAAAVAMAPGSTIFNDMESYNRSPSDTGAVLTFLSAWTDRLHQLGYRSGVYSSANSGIADLANAGPGVLRPDVIWFARWNDQATTTAEPVLPEDQWVHARVHQYHSGTESWGGMALDVDRNAIDVADSSVAFVKAAFTDFLNRPPSADEIAFLVTQLDAGSLTRLAVVQRLAGSTEWVSAIVAALYQSTLGRPGEPGGVAFWTGEIRAGLLSVTEATARFYASEEYYRGIGGGTSSSWITDLYHKLLHRDPEAGGLTFWRDQTSAVGRDRVALQFVQSLESRIDRVDALYLKFLGRLPDPAGAAFWADRVRDDGDVALAADLAASDEYAQRANTRFG